jgi:ABC-type xylose transport system permease subunit
MKLERNARSPLRAGDSSVLMAIVLVALWAILAVVPGTRGVFLTQENLATLLVQSSVLLVVSVGMTMVVLIRGIDLSVGAGVALTGVVAALVQQKLGGSAPIAIAAALAVGALIGAWHGYWSGWLGVPSFIVTLAGFKAYRGAALVLSGAKGLSPMSDGFETLAGSIPTGATYAIVIAVLGLGVAMTLRDAARRKLFELEPLTSRVVATRIGAQVVLAIVILAVFGDRGMPVLVLIAGAVAVAGVFITRRTRFGRHLYAIGGNPEAARLSGIDVKKTTLGAFVIVGLLTALAGVMLAARVNGVTPGSQGNLLELNAVTAVVIGGTALGGGRGTVTGTVLGTLVFSTLANGMNHLRVDSNLQLIFTGLVLLVAVQISKGKRS